MNVPIPPFSLASTLLVIALSACSGPQQMQRGENRDNGHGNQPVENEMQYPPWGDVGKNPAEPKGVELTLPESNLVADLHGNPNDPALAIYSFGHYYFLLGQLVSAFMEEQPEAQGRVYYQTVPRIVNEEALKGDNTITTGNLTITAHPDVFMGGLEAVEELVEDGLLEEPLVPIMTTVMGIMVHRNNPKNIQSLEDLARPGVKLVMPDPERSGAAQNMVEMLRKVGGEELANTIFEEKVESGETIIVDLHHRETPAALMKGEADAGLTWSTEALHQERIGNPIILVPIAEEQNITGVFAAARVVNGPNPQMAEAWLQFLTSGEGERLIEENGFQVVRNNDQ